MEAPHLHICQELLELEADVRYQEIARVEDETIAYEAGIHPFLVSASHAAVHQRLGQWKQEDEFTAAFARLLASATNSHVLYLRRKTTTDPNWDTHSLYKQTLEELVQRHEIRFILDLHAVHEKRRFGLALGTMKGQSCPRTRELILSTLGEHGFQQAAREEHMRLDVDRRFTAIGKHGQETITRFAWERLGVEAAQIEMHPALRIVERRPDATERKPYQANPDLVHAALTALMHVIEKIHHEVGSV